MQGTCGSAMGLHAIQLLEVKSQKLSQNLQIIHFETMER